MHKNNILKRFKHAAAILTAALVFAATAGTAFGADSNYKFSDIDLKISVPEELVCLTRSTTNNNSYLEKLGVEDAAELRTMMEANDVYLEAVNKDITYEIVVTGKKASGSLSNFDSTDDETLNNLFNEYIDACDNIENDGVTENVTASSIYNYNGIKYFQTDVTTVSKTMVTVYSRKYYTIMQGNVYTFTLQANGLKLDNSMSEQLLSVVNSAQFTPVKKSIFENNIITELLSNLITVGVPIGILALLVYLLGRTKKKTAKQIAEEEVILRAKYAEEAKAAEEVKEAKAKSEANKNNN